MIEGYRGGGTNLSQTPSLFQAVVKRAALKMMADHGEHTLVRASEEVSAQISQGLYVLAGSWHPTELGGFFTDRRHPYKHADDQNHLLDGLRKAGLPA